MSPEQYWSTNKYRSVPLSYHFSFLNYSVEKEISRDIFSLHPNSDSHSMNRLFNYKANGSHLLLFMRLGAKEEQKYELINHPFLVFLLPLICSCHEHYVWYSDLWQLHNYKFRHLTAELHLNWCPLTLTAGWSSKSLVLTLLTLVLTLLAV